MKRDIKKNIFRESNILQTLATSQIYKYTDNNAETNQIMQKNSKEIIFQRGLLQKRKKSSSGLNQVLNIDEQKQKDDAANESSKLLSTQDSTNKGISILRLNNKLSNLASIKEEPFNMQVSPIDPNQRNAQSSLKINIKNGNGKINQLGPLSQTSSMRFPQSTRISPDKSKKLFFPNINLSSIKKTNEQQAPLDKRIGSQNFRSVGKNLFNSDFSQFEDKEAQSLRMNSISNLLHINNSTTFQVSPQKEQRNSGAATHRMQQTQNIFITDFKMNENKLEMTKLPFQLKFNNSQANTPFVDDLNEQVTDTSVTRRRVKFINNVENSNATPQTNHHSSIVSSSMKNQIIKDSSIEEQARRTNLTSNTQNITLNQSHSCFQLISERTKKLKERIVIQDKGQFAPEFDYLLKSIKKIENSHLPFLPKCCIDTLNGKQSFSQNQSRGGDNFRFTQNDFSKDSSLDDFESFIKGGSPSKTSRNTPKISFRKSSVQPSPNKKPILKVGISPQKISTFSMAKQQRRRHPNQQIQQLSSQKSHVDFIKDPIQKLKSQHQYDLDILNNQNLCSKVINGELVLLNDKINKLSEFLQCVLKKIKKEIFIEIEEKQQAALNNLIERVITKVYLIGSTCIQEYRDSPEQIGVSPIQDIQELHNTLIFDERRAFDQNVKALFQIQEFMIDCSDAYFVLQKEPERKQIKGRQAQMLLDLIAKTRFLTLEIILKIKQLFKALKRIKEWNLQKQKFQKYLEIDKNTQDILSPPNSPLKRRMTIKEIMDIKKNQRLEQEKLEREKKNVLRRQETFCYSQFKNQEQDNSLNKTSDDNSSSFSSTSESLDNSQEISPNISLNYLTLISPQKDQSLNNSQAPRKTLFQIKQEEKEKLETKLHKLNFEQKMSKKSISKKTLQHIHQMMSKINNADNFLVETKINKREPEFSQKIDLYGRDGRVAFEKRNLDMELQNIKHIEKALHFGKMKSDNKKLRSSIAELDGTLDIQKQSINNIKNNLDYKVKNKY
eukprot:403337283